LRDAVDKEVKSEPTARLKSVLEALSIATSTWYYRPQERKQDRRRHRRKPVPRFLADKVVLMAEANPWYGYKRIAVMCRRAGVFVSNRQVYRVMRENNLLQKARKSRKAELYQTLKLYELLPQAPNELWQMDVTYIHIPGFGWWYAITVIDYFSRYLLTLRLTSSYSAPEAIEALKDARAHAERIHGPLTKEPFVVTDNGPSFIARRFQGFIRGDYVHVRIQYRTPTQLGLLERFHESLKREEVYWRLYDNPEHARECLAEFHDRYNNLRPHWALVPEEGGDPLVPAEVYVDGRKTRIPRWQGWARGVKEKLDELLLEAAA